MRLPRAKHVAAVWIGALGVAVLLGVNAGPVRAYRLYPSTVFPKAFTIALVVEENSDGSTALMVERPIDADSLAKQQLGPRALSLSEADGRIRRQMALYPEKKLALIHRTIQRDERGITIHDEEPTTPAP